MVFACLLPVRGWALDPAKDLFQYNLRTWTRQNGLPVNAINTITQAADGYIYLGTATGLIRFDGIDFDQIDLSAVTSLHSTLVRTLVPDPNGGLLVGFENNAFGRFDGKTFTFRGRPEWGGLNLNVREMVLGKDGALWIAADREAARITAEGQYEALIKGTPEFKVALLCSYQDSAGRVWFGTASSGVFYYESGTLHKLEDSAIEGANSIVEDQNGQIWIAGNTGVRCYDRALHLNNVLELNTECMRLLVDRQGVLWIGTQTLGLCRYLNGKCTYFRKADGLTSDHVTAIFEGSEGSIWAGTLGGLAQLVDVKFPTISAVAGARDAAASSVYASQRGGIWAGCRKGISYYDGTLTTYAEGMPRGSVKRVFEARNGDVYFVSGISTLSVFADGKVVGSYGAPDLVVGLVEDAQSVIASVGGKLYRADRTGLRPYQFSGDVPEFTWIFNLIASRDQGIWVSSEKGLYKIKDGVVQKHFGSESFPDPRVQWTWEDEDGVLWLSLYTGVGRIKDDQVKCLGRNDGLLDENTHAVMPDNLNGLWIDSSRGLYWIDRGEIEQWAKGTLNRVKAIAYDGAEVIKTADKTMRQERVACKTSDGRIWFPSEKGVAVIDPAHVPVHGKPPIVHLKQMLANRTRIDAKDAVVPPGEGELEFQFTAATFIAPQKTKFRYQLKGYDPTWVEAGERRVAFYTNLKPGDYIFEVMAMNADGYWSETADSVNVRLLPHFYQTLWFRIFCVGIVAAGAGGLVMRRVAQVNAKQRALREARDALEAQVRLRTAELARANDSLQEQIQLYRQTEAELKVRTASLEKEIEERKQMQAEVERVHRALLDASRQAGMAEIATNVLHNVGNVLTSVTVSAGVVLDAVKRSSIKGVARIGALLRENEGNLGHFLTTDPRGKRVVEYLAQLGDQLVNEQSVALKELDELNGNIEHIKQIVSMQQSYATISGVTEIVDLRDLVEDSLRMNVDALRRHGVELVRELEELPPVNVEKHKILQILVNLVRNAKYACVDSGRPDKRVIVRMVTENERVKISVTDNGVGIPAENLTRIFQHGFTTRKDGHGFGLHSGAIAAKNMGGTLIASSDGPGKGATFTLELPVELPVEAELAQR